MRKLVGRLGVLGLAVALVGLSFSPASATLNLFYAAQNAALSIDGAVAGESCAAAAACNLLQSNVPSNATVLAAFLYVADIFGSNPPPPDGSVTLAGNTLNLSTFTLLAPDANGANTYRRDVTSIMKPIIEGTGGLQTHTYAESASLDGAVLVVSYRNASTLGTAIILDGELAQAGDSTTLNFAEAYAGGDVFMSLASSFSFGDGQFTTVDVVTSSSPSRRLSGCAGGNDDGGFIGANGNLMTVGGVGDDPGNPGQCNGDDADDELYNLALGTPADSTPFLANGDTSVTFNTTNPSFDDNVFFIAFTSSFRVTDVDDEQIPTDDDGGPPEESPSIPNPASLVILGAGLLVAAVARRRRG